MNSLLPLWKTVRQTLHEVRQAWSLAGDFNSRLRLASDLVLYRILKVIDLKSRNQERTIRCSNGLVFTYRLNRGDIQSIREAWLDNAYRLPFSLKPGLVVDLGANIGLTSLWLHQQYGCDKIIAIEPNPSNAQLVRKNLINNKINAIVIEAAIGPTDGVVTFESSQNSNMGRVAVNGEQTTTGEQVKMISMTTLLAELPHDQEVDLVKLDIEGGEQQLLSGDLSWLKRVKAIIAEFHPEVVDYPDLIKTIQQQEFQYIPAHTLAHDNMDIFVRQSIAASVLAA